MFQYNVHIYAYSLEPGIDKFDLIVKEVQVNLESSFKRAL